MAIKEYISNQQKHDSGDNGLPRLPDGVSAGNVCLAGSRAAIGPRFLTRCCGGARGCWHLLCLTRAVPDKCGS